MDRQLCAEPQQVIVTRDKQGILRGGERQQVVVSGVDRSHRRWGIRIGRGGRSAPQPVDDCFGVFRRDPTAELGVGERALELGQEERRDDQLEATLLPGA